MARKNVSWNNAGIELPGDAKEAIKARVRGILGKNGMDRHVWLAVLEAGFRLSDERLLQMALEFSRSEQAATAAGRPEEFERLVASIASEVQLLPLEPEASPAPPRRNSARPKRGA